MDESKMDEPQADESQPLVRAPDESTPALPARDRRVRRRLRIAVALTLVVAVVLLGVLQRIGVIDFRGGPAQPVARLAVIDDKGALTTLDRGGGSVVPYSVPGVTFQFPAWSPDGTRIAAIGAGSDGKGLIDVFTARTTGAGETDPPIIYESTDRPPFYLYWRPDSKALTFLTSEATDIALRIAPADGSHTEAIVRHGSPLYWDFADHDRLLVHIGITGADAFLGEIDLAGATKEPAVLAPGAFRAPLISNDYKDRAYVVPSSDSAGTLVLETRDGSSRHTTPVFGLAALGFDPSGTNLAFISPKTAQDQAIGIPIGPLRILDSGTGAVTTLRDGSVVAFFWAPDGRTVAALQLDVAGGGGVASAAAVRTVAAPLAAASPSPGVGLRLVFVDVATGALRSERQVQLSALFLTQLLPFFDQYALSHRVWSPDSASIALPLVGDGGANQIFVIRADGSGFNRVADGTTAFWSP
jgi:TolB protein